MPGKTLAIPILSILLVSCAATVALNELPRIEGGEDGLVFLIRPKIFFGSAFATDVYVDGQLLSKLKNNSFTYFHASPGKHVITNRKLHSLGNWPELELEISVEKGREYFYLFDLRVTTETESVQGSIIASGTYVPLQYDVPKYTVEGAKWTELDPERGRNIVSQMRCSRPSKNEF